MIESPAALYADSISHRYGGAAVLRDISLTVRRGEFISVIGPSGCGKSTLLKILCGAIRPTEGQVLVDDLNITKAAPRDSRVIMVWQSLALFPHLNVGKNVGFGLVVRHRPKDEIARAVADMLDLLDLGGYETRSVGSLSGGEQQRVALARAMIVAPTVMLLDEPLKGLDRHLKALVNRKVLELHRRLGITTLMVTHEQADALSMADRVAVMDNGRIVQIGSPADVVSRPNSEFVARFIGDHNVFIATVCARETEFVSVACGEATYSGRIADWVRFDASPGLPLAYVIDSHKIELGTRNDTTCHGRVTSILSMGLIRRVEVDAGALGVIKLQIPEWANVELRVDDVVNLSWSRGNAYVLPIGFVDS